MADTTDRRTEGARTTQNPLASYTARPRATRTTISCSGTVAGLECKSGQQRWVAEERAVFPSVGSAGVNQNNKGPRNATTSNQSPDAPLFTFYSLSEIAKDYPIGYPQLPSLYHHFTITLPSLYHHFTITLLLLYYRFIQAFTSYYL
jgi:hypothetical protein